MGNVYKSHKKTGNREITEKLCTSCQVMKSISSFEKSRDICMTCRKREYRARIKAKSLVSACGTTNNQNMESK